MPQLEVAAKVSWCIHSGHCCDWASLTTTILCPKCWTHYIWMKSMLKLDYTRGQSICLVLYRQTEICFTSALNHLDTPNWLIPKALCMALAEFVLLWLGAGVKQGQVWAALLLWWAPCHTLEGQNFLKWQKQGNGESKLVLHVPQRYSVCCGFWKQLLVSMVI